MKKLLCVLMFGMVFGQTDVSQKLFTIESEDQHVRTLSDILPNYDLDWALINAVGTSTAECYINIATIGNASMHILATSGSTLFYPSSNKSSTFYIDKDTGFVFGFGQHGTHTCTILVTAEFPQEDTGYIEDGFDYCLEEGQNLIASPCREPIPIETALPSEIANNLTGIIGEGVASTNIEGLGWVGSLTGLGGGKGYWFSSNVEGCFNYTCTEN